MGLATLIKQLYLQSIGGTAPSGAASSSGDISQMVKYLVANPGAPTWPKLPPLNELNPKSPFGFYGSAPGTTVLQDMFGNAWGGSGTWVQVWDSTYKRYYIRNTTGTACRMGGSVFGAEPLPDGPWMGKMPSFDLDSDRYLHPDTAFDCFVMEFLVAFKGTVTGASGVGIAANGLSNGFQTAGQRAIGAYRKAGTGWNLGTSDGTTASETAEAADTSDGNPHILRIEWHNKATVTVRLYVDGTLKVTKTTNLPALGTSWLSYIGGVVDTAEASDDMRLYAACHYWKDSAA